MWSTRTASSWPLLACAALFALIEPGCGGTSVVEPAGEDGNAATDSSHVEGAVPFVADEAELMKLRPPRSASRGPIEWVVANGTGCPRGTWNVSVSPDGQAMTLVFSAYEASVEPGQASAEKTCDIDVKLRAVQGAGSTLGSFYFAGFVALESEGMRASQSASYRFRGPAVVTGDPRVDFEGPVDSEYTFKDDVAARRSRERRCGLNGVLHITSRIRIDNDGAKTGSGQMNTQAVDGTVKMGLQFVPAQC